MHSRWNPLKDREFIATYLVPALAERYRELGLDFDTEMELDTVLSAIEPAVRKAGHDWTSEEQSRRAADRRHHLSNIRRQWRTMERRIVGEWGDGLDELTVLARMFQDYCVEFDKRRDPESVRLDMLSRLAARAMLVVSEIHALLRTGHPAGAGARWRTLHEIHVITEVLATGDEDLALRYWAHQIVTDHQHSKAAAERGDDGYVQRLAELAEQYAIVRDLVPKFTTPYGWAHEPGRNPKTNAITFADLENSVQASHLRADYKFASWFVHGGSSALEDALIPFNSRAIALLGPTDDLIDLPALQTARTLVQISQTVLSSDGHSPITIGQTRALAAKLTEVRMAFAEAARVFVKTRPLRTKMTPERRRRASGHYRSAPRLGPQDPS